MKANEKSVLKYTIALLLLSVILVILFFLQKKEKITYAYEMIDNYNNNNLVISNAEKINLDEIIQKNTKNLLR